MSNADDTIIDYLVEIICPVLIMLMVGSMAFFLIELFYHGGFFSRIHWIVGLFVMATVLIGRLSIEFDRSHATLYSIPLFVVSEMAIWRFAPEVLGIGTVIMLIVWWSADRLTWNCTFIDGGQEDAGEGLLDFAAEPDDPYAASKRRSTGSRVANFLQGMIPGDQRTHAPGVWILYFALIAIPMYGMAQWWTSSGHMAESARESATRYVVIYTASSLGLLMSTSLLGLRRYLGRRGVNMPGFLAVNWLIAGAMMIVVFVVLALLLPRPGADYPMPDVSKLIPQKQEEQEPEDENKTREDMPSQNDSGNSSSMRSGKGADRPDMKTSDRSVGGEGVTSDQPGSSRSESRESDHANGAPQENSGSNQTSPSDQGKQAGGGDQNEGDQSGENSGQSESSQSSNASNNQGSEQNNTSKNKPDDNRGSQQSESSQQTEPSGGEPESRNQPENNGESGANQRQEAKSYDDMADQQQAHQVKQRELFSRGSALIGEMLQGLFRWLVLCVVVVASIFVAIKYRNEILAAIGEMMKSLANVLRGLLDLLNLRFGWKKRGETEQQAAEPVTSAQREPRKMPDNPYHTGQADRMPPEQLVRVTFDALHALSDRHGMAKRDEETPLEFINRMQADLHLSKEVIARFGKSYCRIVYSSDDTMTGSADNKIRQTCRQVWDAVQSAAMHNVEHAPKPTG